MTQSHQPINQIALDTLKAATNVVLVYANSAKPTLIKIGLVFVSVCSFWIFGLVLLALAVRDAVVLGDEPEKIWTSVALAFVAFLLSGFSAWIGTTIIRKKDDKRTGTPSYQPAF